ncbi:MAG: hypothetical protein NDJ89_10925 [Oligoflexia bacterium]|nr:hypothetical protein [Oligoflexia bacterium]
MKTRNHTNLRILIVAFVAVTSSFAFGGISSYTGAGGTGSSSRFVVAQTPISEEAIELMVSGRSPSENLRVKLEEKRAEMAEVIGTENASRLSDEALAALLVQENQSK